MGSALPAGQKCPCGHTTALALELLSPWHKYPTEHAPLGSDKPDVPQKSPAGHGIGNADPAGQYDPTGQSPPHIPLLVLAKYCLQSGSSQTVVLESHIVPVADADPISQ